MGNGSEKGGNSWTGHSRPGQGVLLWGHGPALPSSYSDVVFSATLRVTAIKASVSGLDHHPGQLVGLLATTQGRHLGGQMKIPDGNMGSGSQLLGHVPAA